MQMLERLQFCEVEYINNFSSYISSQTLSFEALYLFKGEFGQLLDPYIHAIFINSQNISIVRDIRALHDLNDAQYVVEHFPLHTLEGFTFDQPRLSEYLSDLFADREECSESQLQTHSIEMVRKYGNNSIVQHVIAFITALDYMDIQQLYLFGDNTKANQLLDAQIEKDEIIENYQEAIKHLIDHIQVITEKSSKAILKRILTQIKSNLVELPANHSKGTEAKNRWDEVGMLSENKNDEVRELCCTAFYALNKTEQLAVKLNLIECATVEIDSFQTLSDIDMLVDVDTFIIHLMQTLIHNARIDWSDKVW